MGSLDAVLSLLESQPWAVRCRFTVRREGRRANFRQGGMQADVREVGDGTVEVMYEQALHEVTRVRLGPEPAAELLVAVLQRDRLVRVDVPHAGSTARRAEGERMGAWGHQPWDNDAAGDFFIDLFPPDFHEKVMTALREEDLDGGEWRAAAWVVYQLAHSGYVWPGGGEAMAAACEAAAGRLEQLATESEQGDEFWDWEQLRREAGELRARRHRSLGQ